MATSSNDDAAYNNTTSVDFSKPLDTTKLNGLVALVTGGASGLGLGICKALADAGAHVTIADINPDGESIAGDLRARHGPNAVTFIHTDVTSWEAQVRAFKRALTSSPRSTVDLVIPCAGVTGTSMVFTATPKDLPEGEDPPPPPMATLDVNLTGVYYSTNLALHYFAKGRPKEDGEKKHILFISSLAGYIELPLVADYQASKFGVRGLWKAIRGAGGMFGGVRTNLIAPTFIRTQMVAGIAEDLVKAGVLLGEVEDVVKVVMRCVCDSSIDGESQIVTLTLAETELKPIVCVASGVMKCTSYSVFHFVSVTNASVNTPFSSVCIPPLLCHFKSRSSLLRLVPIALYSPGLSSILY